MWESSSSYSSCLPSSADIFMIPADWEQQEGGQEEEEDVNAK